MAKRRVYGEGTVTYREKENRYQVSVPGVDGKRRYAYAKTEREAERLRRKLLAEAEQGKLPESKQPFSKHAHEWLEMKSKTGDHMASTALNVGYRFHAHFLPALGDLPLNKITPGHIQKLYNKLLDAGIAPSTLKVYHSGLKGCFESAVKQGKIDANPCSKVALPKSKKPKNSYLSLEDADKLVQACKGHRVLDALLPVALGTGARECELLALTWDDIDLDRGMLRINKTLVRKRGSKGETRVVLAVNKPKTESGIRDITLPGFVLEALRMYKIRQMKQALASGKPVSQLVFSTKNGDYIWPNSLVDQLQRRISKKGIGLDIRFHDLRHTSATLLLEAGIPANVVQERLGHADLRTTLAVYGHVTARMKDQASTTLDTLFSGAKNVSEVI
jgi:integrase